MVPPNKKKTDERQAADRGYWFTEGRYQLVSLCSRSTSEEQGLEPSRNLLSNGTSYRKMAPFCVSGSSLQSILHTPLE